MRSLISYRVKYFRGALTASEISVIHPFGCFNFLATAVHAEGVVEENASILSNFTFTKSSFNLKVPLNASYIVVLLYKGIRYEKTISLNVTHMKITFQLYDVTEDVSDVIVEENDIIISSKDSGVSAGYDHIQKRWRQGLIGQGVLGGVFTGELREP